MYVFNINKYKNIIILRDRVVPKGLFKRSVLSFEAKKTKSEDEILHTSYRAKKRRLGFRFCAAKNEQPCIGPKREPRRPYGDHHSYERPVD